MPKSYRLFEGNPYARLLTSFSKLDRKYNSRLSKYADALRKIYDDHNIFILPSFTEAHPQVIDESLARLRPVIIFEDIQHVIQNRSGIFVSKRNIESLNETIKFIMKNYNNIKEKIKKNKLPTKEAFINQMIEALED